MLNDAALSGYGSGSAIGPDGAVYVTNGIKGTLIRIDPTTGAAKVVGRGLPPRFIDIGAAMDVAFLGDRAYVLVSVAGASVGGPDDVMGIYRLKGNGRFAVFADLGTWSTNHPPKDPDWFVSQGVHYSMQVWRQGFLVTDAHLARVIRVGPTGRIRELVGFGSTDRVPLGLEVAGGKVYLSTAGPIPHVPSTSKVNWVRPDGSVKVIGRWGRDYAGNRGLVLDVEHDQGQLYGLLQGYWNLEPTDANEGFPAKPRTGEIVVVQPDGTFRTVVGRLDRPTSLELVDGVAYVVTFSGAVMRIEGY
ncbi:hypothetical protein CXG46_13495 [Nocardioides alpinus]|uniref:Sugar lactone lactonase YvrE n=1 Tax=Nocardioides alpinus TaxID=748909 RepID=A0ABX4QVL1_9ACTN|nr:hypothetical protein CXG46_13495 [Nocardioides alpinus]